MRVLVATTSVHTTAAACDYLSSRMTADDEVIVLTVSEPDLADRDAGDAGNVARTRLVSPTVETVAREGNPADVIRTVADERAVDSIILGQHRGEPDLAGDPPGSTVRAVLTDADRPVTVLPV